MVGEVRSGGVSIPKTFEKEYQSPSEVSEFVSKIFALFPTLTGAERIELFNKQNIETDRTGIPVVKPDEVCIFQDMLQRRLGEEIADTSSKRIIYITTNGYSPDGILKEVVDIAFKHYSTDAFFSWNATTRITVEQNKFSLHMWFGN